MAVPDSALATLAHAQKSTAPETAKRVLLVEDSGSFRRALTTMLANSGFAVTAHEDGHAALQAIRQQSFDCIVLDLFVPKLNGMVLLGIVKGDPRLRHIPVIVLSANQGGRDLARVKQLGAHVVTKNSGPMEQTGQRLLETMHGAIR